MEPYIIPLSDVRLADVPQVGGKNASLGELQGALASEGINVPDGFAITAAAFREFLRVNELEEHLANLMRWVQRPAYDNLHEMGSRARALILDAVMPEALKVDITTAYRSLCQQEKMHVAVRSSATAEDLPDASFAGQHDSFLNIEGERNLLNAVQHCFASLYNDRAIKYREDKGFRHDQVAISVGVQKMVNASEGGAGVCFTLEPETGFRDIIHLSAVWGLGESIVQGISSPDEYYVFKPTLEQGKKAIIQRKIGAKEFTMQYAAGGRNITSVPTALDRRQAFVLADAEVYQLSRWALAIERHYGRPMDIEWARDGGTGKIFIVQARPETVHAAAHQPMRSFYTIREKGACLVKERQSGKK
ncbi:hypothetical protein MKQ70_19900 [Chitinophaga sedimenti]|uniref:PEP/pyruvate-binding domain-containing protein n=1 Tax=Chitinophaga sedimenti TaxID=2033606 RepID=UPI00200448D3|nr:PEP/pyruvate-binding domain-containing protein [Chitinophaga sedimenti]MCK7557145.1 hypothetical protein [Chitinophaga sedimenti]